MIVLFETPSGYAFFKLVDEKKLSKVDDLYRHFQTAEGASQILKLKHFEKFSDTTEALAATTAVVDGKLSKLLKKAIKKVIQTDVQDQLLVADAKLGNIIKEKMNLSCVTNSSVQELMRCIRSQTESLIDEVKDSAAMALGLAHSLSRYKLKFSPEKVDTMIVQAICLLDELDKELNNYIMRCREWYGWHFPELGKIITDNTVFVKTVKLIGTRDNVVDTDLSDILPEEVESKVKEAAEISMGTEISEEDILNIQHLCDEVLEMNNYRGQLYEYLKSRMIAIAPNLTVLLGELVGARLISHSGSLVNLAKMPASTIQILGAEKALFRALKTHKDTPKYGLIYHSSLVGTASVKNKGKISRSLAAKSALACRVDALGEASEEALNQLGIDHRAKLEYRLQCLEEGNLQKISGTAKAKAKFEKYQAKSEVYDTYPQVADSTVAPGKKRKIKTEPEEEDIENTSFLEMKPSKKVKIEAKEDEDDGKDSISEQKVKKKKKKSKESTFPEEDTPQPEEEMSSPVVVKGEKKKKKKKNKDAE